MIACMGICLSSLLYNRYSCPFFIPSIFTNMDRTSRTYSMCFCSDLINSHLYSKNSFYDNKCNFPCNITIPFFGNKLYKIRMALQNYSLKPRLVDGEIDNLFFQFFSIKIEENPRLIPLPLWVIICENINMYLRLSMAVLVFLLVVLVSISLVRRRRLPNGYALTQSGT